MGFTKILEKIDELQAAPGQEAQVQAVQRLFKMPTFASSMRLHFDLLPMLAKRTIEKRAQKLIRSIATGPLRPVSTSTPMADSLVRKCQHLVDRVRLHRVCLDIEVRTWGNICEELHHDWEARALLWALLPEVPELHTVVHTGVSFTISECNRRGFPTMSWVE